MPEFRKYVHVRAHTSAKKERLVSHPNHLEIFVHEKAVRNEANRRIRELVAQHMGVSLKQVQIYNGHHSSSKLLSIRI